jgi:hypothetical protein
LQDHRKLPLWHDLSCKLRGTPSDISARYFVESTMLPENWG